MGTRLKWEKVNLKTKMRKQGTIYGGKVRTDAEWKNKVFKDNGDVMTEEEKRSLHYIITGERI